MAAALSARPKKGNQKLLPFYCGITEGKNLKNQPYKHTHYVLIREPVAERLGIKQKSIVKPGGADDIVEGVVFQKNRKKTVGDKKNYEAKRHITRGKKKIEVFCKNYVKDKKGKDVPETYSIGFPSNVPLRLILKFFRDKCPNVVRIGTGGELYQVR